MSLTPLTYAFRFAYVLLAIIMLPLATAHGNLGQALHTLQSAKSGEDSVGTASAWQVVSNASIDDLETLLSAFDDATPTGTNWMSAAIDAMLEREASQGKKPAVELLTAFVLNTGHSSIARETALDLLRNQNRDAADAATRKLSNDPIARMRRPAVAAMIERATTLESTAEQLAAYQEAFQIALDEDHVVACTVALRKLGQPVDHIRKFGFLMHWQVIGPFDYLDGKGFDEAYPPETLSLDNYDGDRGIHSSVEYEGKDGPIRWKSYTNTARNGVVDLNEAISELRDSVAYGATVFESKGQQQVQLRLRQQNSAKVWLNGILVFTQPIGHTGNFFDQYTVPVTLKDGPNLILVKSCQWAGPVYHPFVGNWQMGVRVTDATGNAILAANRPPTPELDPLPGTEEGEEDEQNETDATADEDVDDSETKNKPASD